MGGKWPDWTEWPGWLLALVYLSCALVLMVVVEIVHLLIVKPIAAKVLSSASRAARELVAGLLALRTTQRRHYVLKPETGHLEVRGYDAILVKVYDGVHVQG